MLARELPNYVAKATLRRMLDSAPPNPILDALLQTTPMRLLAQHVYFHRRNATAPAGGYFRPLQAATARQG